MKYGHSSTAGIQRNTNDGFKRAKRLSEKAALVQARAIKRARIYVDENGTRASMRC
jgi:hypothetical protein